MEKTRCVWAGGLDLAIRYHDEEWGVPRYDDLGQFEFLTLESAQAGLSWNTILKKREGYRRCFAEFDPEPVARFTDRDVDRLMANASIVRNRKKIDSAIGNAKIFLDIAAKHGSFCRWFWGFVGGKPIQNAWKDMREVPPTTPLSDAVAKEMKKLGFKFMGSSIVYAHMQATGMVNDHLVTCFRYEQVRALSDGK
ncbi:MAG: DNA-3-methyladenine glycosylase 1 [Candidatus Desulfovibrio kirbyi]|jgi:DNA-3-methyladenine glycosylase I|uniref:DNA-3-methyladenine glycosylase 1 n=1 Tax=Candidatus Desulfovibrio kirbyi TaxID=2696086 RepID=A0A6L2R621_9BACT|nr:DNA-3-methyladenine glycosylase I [Desulfovibrio sp.]GFH62987.1 MAG: DNA-3-methyladenine glycosylase 1 [Candidatus Desulfovibrio kirbyi]